MFYHAASNQYISVGTAFEINGIQYPQNWLNLSLPQEKVDAGLVEVTYEGTREDDRFYWVTENRNGAAISYTNTPKDLAGLKAQWKTQINQNAYTMLLPSDWMEIRNLRDPAYKPEWMTWREAVRSAAAAAAAAIDAAADVPALQAAIQVTWPNDPNFVALG